MDKKIQLYSLATPNGQKVSIALEELQLAYDSHVIDINNGDQFTEDFVNINPNSKIPAIVDPNGPAGTAVNIMESGAILVYLAEKYGQGKLLPIDAEQRLQTMQWLFFQAAGVGPMFGQFGHFFKFGKDNCDHPYPVNRYATEVKRLLAVMDKQLAKQAYLASQEYSIADIATFPWVSCLDVFYEAKDYLQLNEFTHVLSWLEKCLNRPAVKIGMQICPFPDKD